MTEGIPDSKWRSWWNDYIEDYLKDATMAEWQDVMQARYGVLAALLKRKLDHQDYIAEHKINTANHVWVKHFNVLLTKMADGTMTYQEKFDKLAIENVGIEDIESDIREIETTKGIEFESLERKELIDASTKDIKSFNKNKEALEYMKGVPRTRLDEIKQTIKEIPQEDLTFKGTWFGDEFRVILVQKGKSGFRKSFVPDDF